MVGNAKDAALALTHPREFLLSDEGCSRVTYLINGVVYKINRFRFLDNEDEYETANALRAAFRAENVVIPEVSLYGSVLAMEYIEGEVTGECYSAFEECDCPDMCISDAMVANLTMIGWRDPAYGNAMWVDGSLYIIDLA